MGEENIKDDSPSSVTSGSSRVQIDPQNPLPEGSWFWRRTITIALSLGTAISVWHILHSLHDLQDAEGLLTLAKWLIGFNALILTYYFVGPSAAELVNMIQTSRIMRAGIGMAAESARQAGIPAPGARFPASRPTDSQSRPMAPGGPEIDAAPRSRT